MKWSKILILMMVCLMIIPSLNAAMRCSIYDPFRCADDFSPTFNPNNVNCRYFCDGIAVGCWTTNFVCQRCSTDLAGTELCKVEPAAPAPVCVKSTFYQNSDGDSYGSSVTTQACTVPSGYTTRSGDCKDNDPSVYPGAIEVCDGKDNDCDGAVDEGVKSTFYQNIDGDSYGSSITTQACTVPSGYTTRSGDCKDNDPVVYPGAVEQCDGKDNDCDGAVDENILDIINSCTVGYCGTQGTKTSKCIGGSWQVGDCIINPGNTIPVVTKLGLISSNDCILFYALKTNNPGYCLTSSYNGMTGLSATPEYEGQPSEQDLCQNMVLKKNGMCFEACDLSFFNPFVYSVRCQDMSGNLMGTPIGPGVYQPFWGKASFSMDFSVDYTDALK